MRVDIIHRRVALGLQMGKPHSASHHVQHTLTKGCAKGIAQMEFAGTEVNIKIWFNAGP